MNDPDNFLSRWSRRKRQAGAQVWESRQSAPPERNDRGEAATPPCGDEKSPGTPGSEPPASSVPDFDVSSLPPIEAIGADTEYFRVSAERRALGAASCRPFVAFGQRIRRFVTSWLKREFLGRSWSRRDTGIRRSRSQP